MKFGSFRGSSGSFRGSTGSFRGSTTSLRGSTGSFKTSTGSFKTSTGSFSPMWTILHSNAASSGHRDGTINYDESVGIIVAGVIGGIVLIAMVVTVIIACCRCKSVKRKEMRKNRAARKIEESSRDSSIFTVSPPSIYGLDRNREELSDRVLDRNIFKYKPNHFRETHFLPKPGSQVKGYIPRVTYSHDSTLTTIDDLDRSLRKLEEKIDERLNSMKRLDLARSSAHQHGRPGRDITVTAPPLPGWKPDIVESHF